MNKIENKFLLEREKFMPGMFFRQPGKPDKPGFTYSACGPFTENKGTTQTIKEAEDSKFIYQNELDKACFQYDMTYGKVLCDKAFDIA